VFHCADANSRFTLSCTIGRCHESHLSLIITPPVQPFVEFLKSWAARHPEYSFKDRASGRDWRADLDNTFFRGRFSSLRNKLSAAGGAKLFPSKKGYLGPADKALRAFSNRGRAKRN
jgi:hypothetical protein